MPADLLLKNIISLRKKINEIADDENIFTKMLDEAQILVIRLKELSLDSAKEFEISTLESNTNVFFKKLNASELKKEDIDNSNVLVDVLLILNMIKYTYQNLVDSSFRTESELANISQNIDVLKRKKLEYEDLIKSASKLKHLESEINGAELLINNLKTAEEQVDNQINLILDSEKNAAEQLEKIKLVHEQTINLVKKITEEEKEISKQLQQINTNEKEYATLSSDIQELLKTTEEKLKLQDVEIQKIIDDANRASMAGAFKKRKDEATVSIRFLDGCTVIFLAAIVYFLWSIYQNSYTETIFSPILFFSRLPITLPLIWLAWLASKKSAYLTRIKEDYAYKYSSAMAFEGYKKQVQEISPELQVKLLEIAVTNLGDNPIRLFDKKIKHTLIDYEKILEIVKELPGEQVDKVIQSIKEQLIK